MNNYKNIYNFDLTYTQDIECDVKEQAIYDYNHGVLHPRLYFKYYIEPLIRWRDGVYNGSYVEDEDGSVRYEYTGWFDYEVEWSEVDTSKFIYDDNYVVVDDGRRVVSRTWGDGYDTQDDIYKHFFKTCICTCEDVNYKPYLPRGKYSFINKYNDGQLAKPYQYYWFLDALVHWIWSIQQRNLTSTDIILKTTTTRVDYNRADGCDESECTSSWTSSEDSSIEESITDDSISDSDVSDD